MKKWCLFVSILFFCGFVCANGYHVPPGVTSQDIPLSEATDVALIVRDDVAGGWNLEIVAPRFSIKPKNVGDQYVPLEGHANIYVDGVYSGRAYSNWYHISFLEPGTHVAEVRLTSNNNTELSTSNHYLQARDVFLVTEEASDKALEARPKSGTALETGVEGSGFWENRFFQIGLSLIIGFLIGGLVGAFLKKKS